MCTQKLTDARCRKLQKLQREETNRKSAELYRPVTVRVWHQMDGDSDDEMESGDCEKD